MVWTATELRDGAGQIGSVFTAAVATKRRMTEDEIRQHRRSSGYIGAQTRQILPSRGKIGDDTRADALRRIMPSHYIEGGLKPAAGASWDQRAVSTLEGLDNFRSAPHATRSRTRYLAATRT